MSNFLKSTVLVIAMLLSVSIWADNPDKKTESSQKVEKMQWLFVAFGEFQGAGGDGTTYIKITCKGREGICFAFDGTHIYLRTQQGGYQQFSPAVELIDEVPNGNEIDYYYSLP